MRLHTAATGWRSLLISSLLCSKALAKKDEPKITFSEFRFVPYGLQYFDDSDVVMFEDRMEGLVYISDDAGEKWNTVSKVPKGKVLELQMHPFDKKKAYVITTEQTHWKTNDRGNTWKEFFTDSPASLFRQALSFHAGDTDRIIFNGMDCTGIFCEELVSVSQELQQLRANEVPRLCTPSMVSLQMQSSSALILTDAIGPSLPRSSQLGIRIWMPTEYFVWPKDDSRHGGKTTDS